MVSKQKIINGIIDIWQDILKIDDISIDERSHFFKVGGTSILALEMVKQLQKKFSVKLSLLTVAKQPTIEELAIFIQKNQLTLREGSI